MPLVSVIIPSFNHEKFLSRRIESVLTQSFSDFEIICLDDASTDDSAKILARYSSQPNFKFQIGATNSGSTFVQWNRGIQMATGKYVWMAESDDYANKYFLETLVARLEENPDVGIAFCRSWVVDEDDNIVGVTPKIEKNKKAIYLNRFNIPGDVLCKSRLAIANDISNASAVVFKRQLAIECGLAPTHLSLCGDWMFWSKLALKCSIAFEPQPLNYFRVDHSRSVRHSLRLNKEKIVQYKYVHEFISKQLALPFRTKVAFMYFLWRSTLRDASLSPIGSLWSGIGVLWNLIRVHPLSLLIGIVTVAVGCLEMLSYIADGIFRDGARSQTSPNNVR